jgi:elongation factor Ts
MDANLIKKLREETGAGVMECKNALEESRGDFNKAKSILASSADAIAKKKAERATKHGLIESYVHTGRIGVLVEVACESDFVGKSPIFKELAHKLAMQIASMNPKNVDELLDQEFFADQSMKVSDYINSQILQIKENIRVKRFARFEMGEDNE